MKDERKPAEKVMVNNKKFISNKRSAKETARPLFNNSSNLLTKESRVLRNEMNSVSVLAKEKRSEMPEPVINSPGAKSSSE